MRFLAILLPCLLLACNSKPEQPPIKTVRYTVRIYSPNSRGGSATSYAALNWWTNCSKPVETKDGGYVFWSFNNNGEITIPPGILTTSEGSEVTLRR